MKLQNIFRLSLLASSILFLNACSNLPKHTATIKDDSKIVFANDAFDLKGEQALPEKWWLTLNDATLSQLIDTALKNNLNLKQGLLKIQKAKLSVGSAQADQAFKLNATAAISNASGNNSGVASNVNNFSIGVAASYELDLWNKLSQQEESAQLSVKGNEFDDKTLRIATSAEVAIAWYKLIEQTQQLQLLKEQLFIAEGYLQLIEQQFKAGQAIAADILQQRQTVESLIGDRFNTLRQVASFKSQLALLMGDNSFTGDINKNSQVPNLPPLPKAGLKAKVLNNRPDVQAAYNNLAIADKTIAISVANQYPSISLSGSYNRKGTSLDKIFDNWASTLAANLLLPILDGDARELTVKQNKVSYQQSLLSYQNTLLIAAKEVQDALSNEQHQTNYTQSLLKQIEHSKQATAQIRLGYINGALDFQRVLNAVLSDQNLQRSYIKATRQLMEYRINLYRALSGGWTIDKINKEKQQ